MVKCAAQCPERVPLSAAMQLAIGNDAQNAGIADESKLFLGEYGKVTGLAEPAEALKKDKAFLFKLTGCMSRYNPKAAIPL